MEKMNIWEEIQTVRFGAVDKSDSMTLDAILNAFQEAAISHAENLGVGREAMVQSRQAWVLSRMSVYVSRRPQWRETITVRTWPRGSEKLFFLRDYDILDSRGITAVRARSRWLIIDMDKRRPLRPESLAGKLPLNEGIDAYTDAESLAEHSCLQKKTERSAAYTEVDYNGHLNNVSYIRWIEDAMEPALLEQAESMRLDINFLNEVKPGETIGIWLAEINHENASPVCRSARSFAIEGRKVCDNRPAFRAQLCLQDMGKV